MHIGRWKCPEVSSQTKNRVPKERIFPSVFPRLLRWDQPVISAFFEASFCLGKSWTQNLLYQLPVYTVWMTTLHITYSDYDYRRITAWSPKSFVGFLSTPSISTSGNVLDLALLIRKSQQVELKREQLPMDFAFLLHHFLQCAMISMIEYMMVFCCNDPHPPSPQFALSPTKFSLHLGSPPEPLAEESEASQAATPRPVGLDRGLGVTCKNPNPCHKGISKIQTTGPQPTN